MSEPVRRAVRACPVCGDTQVEPLHEMAFAVPDNCALPDHYTIASCTRCGLVYADVDACQADYDRFYTELSKYESETASGGGEQPLDRARLDGLAAYLGDRFEVRDAPLLDAGCGSGGLLAALRDVGFTDLTGLDPSPGCADAVRRGGFGAAEGGILPGTLVSEAESDGSIVSLGEGPGFARRFAYITLSHVLEHLYDLREGVVNVVSWLRPGGLVYIEVPDAGRYHSHYVVPDYYFDLEHVNHFDEGSLRNLAAEVGLDVLDVIQKSVPVSSTLEYPAIGMVCRANGPGAPNAGPELVRTRAAHDSVVEYLRLSHEDAAWAPLEALATSGERIAVWGAGSLAQRLMTGGPLSRCSIVAFVDNDAKKQGSTLAGVPVRAPEWLREFDGPVVVVAAIKGEEVVAQIRAMGLPNRVVAAGGGSVTSG